MASVRIFKPAAPSHYTNLPTYIMPVPAEDLVKLVNTITRLVKQLLSSVPEATRKDKISCVIRADTGCTVHFDTLTFPYSDWRQELLDQSGNCIEQLDEIFSRYRHDVCPYPPGRYWLHASTVVCAICLWRLPLQFASQIQHHRTMALVTRSSHMYMKDVTSMYWVLDDAEELCSHDWGQIRLCRESIVNHPTSNIEP